MRVVVTVEGEVTTRAAQSLATQPGVEVSLLGPSPSSQLEVVDSVEGFDAVVGRERALDAGKAAGVPVIAPGALHGLSGVAWCSPAGLALALAADLASPTRIAVALPDDPGGNESVTFPSPIDTRPARSEPLGDRSVLMAASGDPLAAALVTGDHRDRVIMDDHRFMEAIALAAGVGVWMGNPQGSLRSWDHGDPYLRTATEMGLVVGERTSA